MSTKFGAGREALFHFEWALLDTRVKCGEHDAQENQRWARRQENPR